MDAPANPVRRAVTRAFGDLRFPQLFLLTAVFFVADLLIPDLIPFVDEIVLGLLTMLLATWRKHKP